MSRLFVTIVVVIGAEVVGGTGLRGEKNRIIFLDISTKSNSKGIDNR